MPGGGSKKGERRGGRKKGTLNKFSGSLKDMILGALADVGGRTYLAEQARSNPSIFVGLVGRVLPLQVKDGGADPMVPTTIVHEYRDK